MYTYTHILTLKYIYCLLNEALNSLMMGGTYVCFCSHKVRLYIPLVFNNRDCKYSFNACDVSCDACDSFLNTLYIINLFIASNTPTWCELLLFLFGQ